MSLLNRLVIIYSIGYLLNINFWYLYAYGIRLSVALFYLYISLTGIHTQLAYS